MFNVCIFLNNSGVQYMLGYKTYEKAVKTRQYYHEHQVDGKTSIVFKDDFGTELDIRVADIQTFLIEDAYKATEAKYERDIVTKRMNQAFLERRASDVELLRLYPSNMGHTPPIGGLN